LIAEGDRTAERTFDAPSLGFSRTGDWIVEELVFRFLLIRGDTLGGSMRNVGGMLAQRKLTRAILSTLNIAGIAYQYQDTKRRWFKTGNDFKDESDIRGLYWQINGRDAFYFTT